MRCLAVFAQQLLQMLHILDRITAFAERRDDVQRIAGRDSTIMSFRLTPIQRHYVRLRFLLQRLATLLHQ